jgi:hypothetical protein
MKGGREGGREVRKAVGTAVENVVEVVGMAVEIEGETEGGMAMGMAGRIDVRMGGGIAKGMMRGMMGGMACWPSGGLAERWEVGGTIARMNARMDARRQCASTVNKGVGGMDGLRRCTLDWTLGWLGGLAERLPEWMSGREGARSTVGRSWPNGWVGRMDRLEDGWVELVGDEVTGWQGVT